MDAPLASGNTTSRVCRRCRSGEMLGSRYASEIPALGHDLGWRRNLCSWKQRKNSGIPTLSLRKSLLKASISYKWYDEEDWHKVIFIDSKKWISISEAGNTGPVEIGMIGKRYERGRCFVLWVAIGLFSVPMRIPTNVLDYKFDKLPAWVRIQSYPGWACPLDHAGSLLVPTSC